MKPLLASISLCAIAASSGAHAQTETRRQADEIVVTAAAPDRTGLATKTDTPLVEVPQSISVVTRDELDMRGVQTVPDAVRYVAGVQTGGTGLDSRSDELAIRGFDSGSFTGNQYFDGLRSQPGGQWTLLQYDAYNLERVEVLKGPSAVLFGAVAPGGLINLVTKRPQEEAAGEVGIQYGSHGQWRGTLDTTGPLTADETLSYRLVGMVRDGGSEVDHTDLGRWFVAPSLTWHPSVDTTLTVLGHYQKDFGGSTFQFLPTYGTGLPNPHGALKPNSFLGEPGFNTFDREQWAVGYGLVQQVTDDWQIRQNARFTYIHSLFEAVVSDDLYSPDTLDYFGITEDDPGFYRRLERRAVRGIGTSRAWAVDTQSQWTVTTGAVEHVILAGVDYFRTKWHQTRAGAYFDSDVAPIPPILDIFNPVYAGGIDDSGFESQGNYGTRNRQIGLYAQDQIKAGQLRLTIGGRQDWFRTYDDDFDDGTVTKTAQKAFTWRAGAAWLLDSGFAPYASYAQSFEPTSGLDQNGNAFKPTRGVQYEAGVKYDIPGGKGFLTLAVYDLKQKNILTADPACAGDPLCDNEVQIGELRNRGVELEGTLRPVTGLYLTRSVTRMDAKITRDEYGNQGNRVFQVPKWIASLYADYTLQSGALAGLGLGAGVRHTGGLFGDNENRLAVPGYTLVDASLRYEFGDERGGQRPWRLALNAANLLDKTYLISCSAWGCGFGSTRNVTVNLSYRW
jgi:iron complex outermembrane receptor protein